MILSIRSEKTVPGAPNFRNAAGVGTRIVPNPGHLVIRTGALGHVMAAHASWGAEVRP